MARAAFYPDDENDDVTASSSVSYSAGDYLTENEKKVYDALTVAIKAVSEGRESITQFMLSKEMLDMDLGSVSFTLSDLGLDSFVNSDGSLREEAFFEAQDRIGDYPFDIAKVLESLRMDLPFDLYWYARWSHIGTAWSAIIENDTITMIREKLV